MENIEIILSEFNKNLINQFFYDELKISKFKLKSSHFFDSLSEKDLYFSQVENIEKILTPKGTGNILLEEFQLGISLKDVLIVLSFDEQDGDIVLNFPESELFKYERNNNQTRWKKLVRFLVSLREKYDIPKIVIGYEPATDEDTLLIEIDNEVTFYDTEIEKFIKNDE
ncbi:hypothetical protein [Fictibacillus macauensis]|uniref:hypothetical protein n=1 Tax=Fictibacillus macauensis TaxID=245160 RepID=UPI0002F7E58F|nr:hypothetical protein [Fictibacillus macauensis]